MTAGVLFGGDAPQEQPVQHAESDGAPGLVPAGRRDAVRRERIEVVAQQISLGVPALCHRQCGGDVIADVEVPPAALDELPVDQRRDAVGIDEQVAHVGITVDDAPRLGCHLGGGAGDETSVRVDEPVRVADLVGYLLARWVRRSCRR